jgi:hypothetical protein
MKPSTRNSTRCLDVTADKQLHVHIPGTSAGQVCCIAGVLPLMQQTWRQLAADMEQQQRSLQQQQQQPASAVQLDNTPVQPAAQAGQHLARLTTTTSLLLQLWVKCIGNGDPQQQANSPSRLIAAVSTVAYLADVSTGIAAIWRSEWDLQQWRTASGEAAAEASIAGLKDRGSLSPVHISLAAAKQSLLHLHATACRHKPVQGYVLPGSGGVHNLQWVMLVYAAMLVGQLHNQQGGMSVVQLHITQPNADAGSSSSSSQQGDQSSGGAGSSAATSGNVSSRKSKQGSSKKGDNKKATQAQQASSSSPAAASGPTQQQCSVVPPYHLQLLRVAGVLPHSIEGFDKDALAQHLFAAKLVLSVLLDDLNPHLHLTVQPQPAAAATAAAAAGPGASTSTSSHHSSAADSSPSGGTAAAVLALLDPCSLMWGQCLALLVGPTCPGASGATDKTAQRVLSAAVRLWRSNCKTTRQATVMQAMSQPAAQSMLHMALGQHGCYKSCVELMVPCLLHMRAVGAISAEQYTGDGANLFHELHVLLMTRTMA